MSNTESKKLGEEGYVYVSYGKVKYLSHAVVSALTLRRFDKERPIAIVCTKEHLDVLEQKGLGDLFAVKHEILPENASIVGFKHHIHKFLFFEKNIFLDSDIVWCKHPDNLWLALEPFPFTITGIQTSDNFFGAPKGIGVLKDILLRRRQRTLNRFGLSYLSRVQSGVMYAKDFDLTKKVAEEAQEMLRRIDETHFQSRLKESGRNMESCEWSLAMAMSKLDIPVYPWLQGQSSAQLDYISNYTTHDDDFEKVICKYYPDTFVYNLRGLKIEWLQKFLTKTLSLIPGRGDYINVTPYCLHFGWLHEKQPFLDFADREWEKILKKNDKT